MEKFGEEVMKSRILLTAIAVCTVLGSGKLASAQEPFVGEVRMFAGNFAPRDWALCDGQLLDISQNSALYSILGTTYGGNGRTTFALPDLRGRVPVHAGTGPGLSPQKLGAKGGVESTPLESVRVAVVKPEDTKTPSATVTKIRAARELTTKQPSLGINYIISLRGVYPSRN